MPVPRGLKGGLYRAGLFRPMRSAYRAIFNRSEFRSERKMRTFYSEWIAKGDIVFDVGANIGQYTEIFSSLGAHVIAIEPNPELCEGLRFLTYRGSVTVLPCAAGDTLGRAVLHIYNRDELSSLTDLWSKTRPPWLAPSASATLRSRLRPSIRRQPSMAFLLSSRSMQKGLMMQ